MQLETADALLEDRAPENLARPALHKALSLARANLEEARRSVLDLRATPLEGRSLPQALDDLTKASSTGSLHLACQVSGSGRPLPRRIEAGLYRIAQEALSNIVQHAHARQGVLRLAIFPEEVRLAVEDDGRGFDPAQITPNRFGLMGMRERAHLLGGQLALHSAPGQGTRLEVRIPIQQPARSL